MSVTFRIKASEAQGRRLDPEYHHALRRTRIRSTYPSAKLLSLSYFRTGGTPSTAHPEYWNGSIPWVSAKDFKAFRFEDSEDHVTELALAESTTCYVNRPAVHAEKYRGDGGAHDYDCQWHQSADGGV